MFGRFGRRRRDALPADWKREQPEATASTSSLAPLLAAIESAAGRVYGRYGLPQRPGHYRRPADGGAWEPLGDALTPAEKWALVDAASNHGRWRYCAYEALGAPSDIPAVVRPRRFWRPVRDYASAWPTTPSFRLRI